MKTNEPARTNTPVTDLNTEDCLTYLPNASFRPMAAYEGFWASQQRYAVLMGGAGSGKSYAAAQKVLYRAVTEPGVRILVVRKVARTLRYSCFPLLEQLIDQHKKEFPEGCRKVKARRTDMTFQFENGSEIWMLGLDNPEKIKSIQGITAVWVEEATELDEIDFQQLELRVRGKSAHYKQFTLTFNPVDEGHWIRHRFFKEDQAVPEDTLILKTTYRDNEHLDEEYIRHLEGRVRQDENLYRVYTLGEWGSSRTGEEFYKEFRFSRHVSDPVYNRRLPLHISFDFNLQPYITLTVWQFEKGVAAQIDEICLKNPDNSTIHLCEAFRKRYILHSGRVFVYGDPSGGAGSLQRRDKKSNFEVIYKELEPYYSIVRKVERRAPPLERRNVFINRLLSGAVPQVQIVLSRHCLNTIRDYRLLREDAEGRKVKERRRDKRTGKTAEVLGHCSDANDYLLCSLFRKEFREVFGKVGGLPMAILGCD